MSKMRRFIRALSAALLTTVLIPALCACSQSAVGGEGLYVLEAVSSGGEIIAPDEIYGGECTLELMRAKAVLVLDGARYSGKWSVQDGAFELITDGGISRGTLADGVCTLDLLGSGLLHVFTQDGAAPDNIDESIAAETTLTPVQKLWSGGWYGWWAIDNAQGDWAAIDGQWYDCFARIRFDDSGTGSMTLWDEQTSVDEPMGSVRIKIDEAAGGSMGTASSLDGSFWLAAIEPDEWLLDPSAYGYENMLVISGRYEAGEGSFDYTVVLRPWGTVWNDVEQSAPELLPYYYEDWYLPLAENGAAMPDMLEVPEASPLPQSGNEDTQ